MNCHGHLQRIGKAFPAPADAREDWRVLLELATLLDQSLEWREPKEIFAGLAEAETAFAGTSYETIGDKGVEIATATGEVPTP